MKVGDTVLTCCWHLFIKDKHININIKHKTIKQRTKLQENYSLDLKYTINKIMNGFLMKYDKNTLIKLLLQILLKLARYAHIHQNLCRVASCVQCNEISRHVRGSSCHLWWTWRWDGESWGLAPSSTRGSHPPRWCIRTGSRRRAPCVAKFQTLRYDLYTELRQHDI